MAVSWTSASSAAARRAGTKYSERPGLYRASKSYSPSVTTSTGGSGRGPSPVSTTETAISRPGA